MPVNTLHPEYLKYAQDWQIVRDCIAGETTIKHAGERYLPKTSGQRKAESEIIEISKQPYTAYKNRAQFPEIVAPGLRAMVAVGHRKQATIELPPGMEYLKDSCTKDGAPLDEFARRLTRQTLQTGRTGILVDVDESGQAHFLTYTAEDITNWKTDLEGDSDTFRLVVLREFYDEVADIYEHQMREEYRVLRLENGVYSSEVFRYNEGFFESTEGALPETSGERLLTEIPFVIAGSVDTKPSVDEIPLLPMCRSAVNVYQLSADYRNSLFLTGQSTHWIAGARTEDVGTDCIGPPSIWRLSNTDAKVGILETNGTGIAAHREAINDELQRAAEHGSQLVTEGSQAEAAETVRLRMFSQQATLHSVVQTGGMAIEKALKYAAEWTGKDPEKCVYEPPQDFSDIELNETFFRELVNAWKVGAIPQEVLFEQMREGGMTALEDDELQGLIEEQAFPPSGEPVI